MKPELSLALALITFCVGILHQVWKISQAVSKMQHGFERRDIELSHDIERNAAKIDGLRVEVEHLAEIHTMAVNQLKERIEHVASRLQGNLQSASDRLTDVEGYLVKKTEFEKRH